MKKFLNWMERRPVLSILVISFVLYFIMELCCRHAFFGAVVYLFTRPHIFLFNMLIIAATLSIGFFFKKRVFVTTLISVIWLALAIVDCILLFMRTTPFNFNDILIIPSALSIITVYMRVWQLVLLGIAVVGVIVGMVFLYRKSPSWKRRWARGLITLGSSAALVAALWFLYLGTGAIQRKIYNIADGYENYGFVTCFSESIFIRGVDKPDTYSVRSVKDVAEMLNLKESTKTDEEEEEPASITANIYHPNVIYLQLESFFDPDHVIGAEYSSSPTSYYQELKENYTSGYLSVPSFGAGTANTEFEILTGMNLDDFGPGEYPFSTILKESTSESVAYNLASEGYTSHLIHNNRGTFYSRNTVYPNLGFNSFTSIEYMNDVEVNPLGWAKDAVLTDQIMENLESTEGRDLIYTISVQGHGQYPEEETDEYNVCTIENWGLEDWSEEDLTAFEYYINQVHQMDDFLEDLTDTLSALDEPTILVLYGDHLPDFAFDEEDLDNGDLYQTEYVLWSNFDMEVEHVDLQAFQLTAYVNSRLGIHDGVLTKLHQYRAAHKENYDEETYLSDLQTLEYDMLYGDKVVYNGINPYQPTDMTMGTYAAYISDVSYNRGQKTLSVKGAHFTEWSRVYVNDEELETVFVTSSQLLVKDVDIDDEAAIAVAQVTDENEILSITKNFYMWQSDEGDSRETGDQD